jgi:hypothetical protein
MDNGCMHKIIICLSFVFFVCTSFSSSIANAQEDEDIVSFKNLKQSRINRVKNKLLKINRQILNKKKKIKKEKSSQIKLKYYEELENLEKTYLTAELTFIGVTSEVNLDDAFNVKQLKKPNLFDEIMEILKPALDSIKRVSERPRKIEYLRGEIEILDEKIMSTSAALKKLKAELKRYKKNLSMRTVLKRSIKRVANLAEELQLKLEDHKVKLHKFLSEDKSLIVEVRELFVKFLRTKGKNILLSIVAFFLCLWPLRRWRVRMLNLIRRIVMHSNPDVNTNNEWLMRPISVMYSTGSLLLASGVSLLCLYLLNDWLLVTIIILINSLVIWSLKDKIPQFVEQFKLFMNFGPVREKERVVWKGIPWRVRKLGLYCTLENPFLQGAVIRVHSNEILNCQSRPVLKMEPWFPTRMGDWLELSDETYGQVINQTPELVNVKLLGGAIKSIETTDFLGLKPVNLSKGFLVSVDFGLDYGQQTHITSQIITTVKEHFLNVYQDEFQGSNPKFRNLIVEFDKADTSSLNIRVNVDVNGQFASHKLHIIRDVSKELVNICNKNNYLIPFKQLTIHMESNS